MGAFLPAANGDDSVEFFEMRVRPILTAHCYKCHSAEADAVEGGLRLDSAEGVSEGGHSGPVIVPGDPAKSLLFKAVQLSRDGIQMPPDGERQLESQEVADLEAWIAMGAPYPLSTKTSVSSHSNDPTSKTAKTFWSFQSVVDPPVPEVVDKTWPRTAIDHFILKQMELKGLQPVDDADKRRLIRRASFDLIGLPPTPDEIVAFLNDESPDSFQRLVDRLLATNEYGERWGRHWLDLARYADTAGDENQDFPVPQAYLYRDYVIDSFNRDKPYNIFIQEQIAGDLLPHFTNTERRNGIIATGFIAQSRRYQQKMTQHLVIEDTIDTIGKTILGLSLGCARCHDHKFDPVTAEDYYALYGFFASTRYAYTIEAPPSFQHDFVPLVTQEEADAVLKPFQDQCAKLEEELRELQAQRQSLMEQLLAAGIEPGTPVSEGPLVEMATKYDEMNALHANTMKKREALMASRPRLEDAYAVQDGEPTDARIQLRGNPASLGKEVRRGFLQVLGGQTLPADLKGSGRSELANWLTDPANPLIARVIVNRIWQHHFGRGIVATPSNFGMQGERPTHPDLLDYLASRFIESGWSIKMLHRLIMASHVYQLDSIGRPENNQQDVANKLLWKFPRQRLDAESIRDAILFVSGNLDRSPAGAHPFPIDEKGWIGDPFRALYETDRRSIYVMRQRRAAPHPFFTTFDGADPAASVASRSVSTTPVQALYLMNSKFIVEQAAILARRTVEFCSDEESRIDWMYQLALGRHASRDEINLCSAHLRTVRAQIVPQETSDTIPAQDQLWENLAQVLLSSNEFFYID